MKEGFDQNEMQMEQNVILVKEYSNSLETYHQVAFYLRFTRVGGQKIKTNSKIVWKLQDVIEKFLF